MHFQDIGMGCLIVVNDEEDELSNNTDEFRGRIKKDLLQNKVIDASTVIGTNGSVIHKEKDQVTSDGSTASYYELPPNAKEIQDLIAYKNMNGQMAEIFRGNYRYGECSHSSKLREINKIIFYAEAEKDRLLKYETSS